MLRRRACDARNPLEFFSMAQFEPIGVVRCDRTEMSAGHWATVESRIELDPV